MAPMSVITKLAYTPVGVLYENLEQQYFLGESQLYIHLQVIMPEAHLFIQEVGVLTSLIQEEQVLGTITLVCPRVTYIIFSIGTPIS